MAHVIYGFKEKIIGIHEALLRCPCCESHQQADMIIIGHYCHIYWVPFCPTDKTATTFCTKCGLKRADLSFDQNLLSDYEEIKNKFRHPWYFYIGAGALVFFGLLIAGSIIFE
jgi:hypothetical protein